MKRLKLNLDSSLPCRLLHQKIISTGALQILLGHDGLTNEEVRAIAEPILDNILEGFKTGDYRKYSRDLDDTVKETISQKKFLEIDRQIQSSIGNYQSREYLGFLIKGQMTVVLWY